MADQLLKQKAREILRTEHCLSAEYYILVVLTILVLRTEYYVELGESHISQILGSHHVRREPGCELQYDTLFP